MAPGRTLRAAACATLARIADAAAAVGLVLLAVDPETGLARGPLVGGVLVALLSVPHALGPVVARALDRAAWPGRVLAGFFAAYAVSLAVAGLTVGRAPLAVPMVAAACAGTCGPLLTGGLSSQLAYWMSGRAARRVEALDSATYGAGGILGPVAVTAVAAYVPSAAALGAHGPHAAVLAGHGPSTAMLAVDGPRAAVLAVATCALGAAVLALTLPAAAARRGDGPAMPLREVLLVLWRSVPLRRTTIGTCLTEGGAGALPVACALLAVHLGHSSRDVGVLVTAYGVGALAGSVAVTVLPRGDPARRVPVYAAVIAAAFAAAAYAPGFAVAAACFAVAGLADGPMLAATLSVRSRYAPDAARARIFVTGAGLKIAAASLGAAFAGVAAGLGARTLLLLCAAVVAVGAASMLGAFRRA